MANLKETKKLNKDNNHVNILVEGPLGKVKLSFLKKGKFKLKKEEKGFDNLLKLKDLENLLCFYKKDFYKPFLKRINETLIGVHYGWKARLKLKGRGIKIFVSENFLYLDLGYSHAFRYKIPNNIQIGCFKKGFDYELNLIGINKSLIGNILFKIRNLNKINAYKEKGIIYSYELFSLKQGKKWIRG